MHYDFLPPSAGNADLSNYYTKSQVDTLLASISAPDMGRTEIEVGFKQAYNTAYKELLYNSNGDLEAIDIWETNTKSRKLFSKLFGRTGDKLTSVTIHDEINNRSLIKNFTYSGEMLINISITYGV